MPKISARLALPSDRDASGRDLGAAELALLRQAIDSGHLNSTGGQLVPRFEREFATRFGLGHGVACASGTAAIHAAIGSLRLAPGDEVVTTPITDIGGVLPICYEGGVPVFADVDPVTANVTAETIERAIGPRTRAVIVTHLFGMPCRMHEIVELTRERGLTVIEDCAQAFLAEDEGQLVGTFGELACFSFQQGKHMTTGEGGMVVTDSPERADAVTRFVNKGWGYGDAAPDHDRPGLNYRMTELQAAVGIAQLAKLDSVVDRRIAAADKVAAAVAGLDGIELPHAALPPSGCRHAFWRFALRVDPERVPGGADALGEQLADAGVQCAPRYIKKPAFECAVLALGGRFECVVDADSFAGTRDALARVVVLPWNEHYTDDHCLSIAEAIKLAHERCRAQ